jgi:hypothetical protein
MALSDMNKSSISGHPREVWEGNRLTKAEPALTASSMTLFTQQEKEGLQQSKSKRKEDPHPAFINNRRLQVDQALA